MRILPILIASFILLTILGCSKNELAQLGDLATFDTAAVRCPPPDLRTIAEFRRPAAPPPAGDVTKRAAQEWHDTNEASIARKNRVGQRLIEEYEDCRNAEPAGSATLKSLKTS